MSVRIDWRQECVCPEGRRSIQSLYILPDAQTMPATVWGYQTPKCLPDIANAQMRCCQMIPLLVPPSYTAHPSPPVAYLPLNVPSKPALLAGFFPPFFLPLTPLLSLRALRFSSRFFCLFSLPSAMLVRRSFHSCLLLSFCFCWRFKLFFSR